MIKVAQKRQQLQEKLDANISFVEEKDKELYLKYFRINSLEHLIGRKMRINYIHQMSDNEFSENEIVFTISSYTFTGILYLKVPAIGIGGRADYFGDNCVLKIFPSNDQKNALFCISLMSRHQKETVRYFSEKDDERLKVVLL